MELQCTPQCLEKQIRLQTLSPRLQFDLRRHRLRHGLQWQPGAQSENFYHARAFDVIQIVIGISDTIAADHHSVITKKRDIGIIHCTGDAFTFGVIERKAVVMRIDRDAPVKTHGVLR